MPNVSRCPYRVLTYVPGARPAVTARYFYTFRRARRIYLARGQCRGTRVQLQQLVTTYLAYRDLVGPCVEWRVLIDSRALGNVRHTAQPGAR